jgi:hypothetical protein
MVEYNYSEILPVNVIYKTNNTFEALYGECFIGDRDKRNL